MLVCVLIFLAWLWGGEMRMGSWVGGCLFGTFGVRFWLCIVCLLVGWGREGKEGGLTGSVAAVGFLSGNDLLDALETLWNREMVAFFF